MWHKILISSLFGALIGYSTNWLAILMLFRPYEPFLFFQGVIPARIDDFIYTITTGVVDFESNVFKSKAYKGMFLDTINRYIGNNLNFFQRIILGVAFGTGKLVLAKHMDRLIKELEDTARFILQMELSGIDMREVEKTIRTILHKEFFMLEVYGAILGGILGIFTALILQVIP